MKRPTPAALSILLTLSTMYGQFPSQETPWWLGQQNNKAASEPEIKTEITSKIEPSAQVMPLPKEETSTEKKALARRSEQEIQNVPLYIPHEIESTPQTNVAKKKSNSSSIPKKVVQEEKRTLATVSTTKTEPNTTKSASNFEPDTTKATRKNHQEDFNPTKIVMPQEIFQNEAVMTPKKPISKSSGKSLQDATPSSAPKAQLAVTEARVDEPRPEQLKSKNSPKRIDETPIEKTSWISSIVQASKNSLLKWKSSISSWTNHESVKLPENEAKHDEGMGTTFFVIHSKKVLKRRER